MHWQYTGQELECYPRVPENIAQPWDAADEYLLGTMDRTSRALIFNDRYGALALNLPEAQLWLESACARTAIERNLERNGQNATRHWMSEPSEESDWPEQILIRAPKDFEQLQYWLWLCQQHCPASTSIYIAGMSKHIPVKWLKWLEAHCESYQQHPIQRKARLLTLNGLTLPAPTSLMQGYQAGGLSFQALPGVFGRHQMDMGGRFLLETLERQSIPVLGRVCDLGCGNGLLGLSLKSRQPELDLVMTDDSLAAVLSARHNIEINSTLLDDPAISQTISVVHGDTLSAVDGPLDTIICNPPFHDGHRQMTNLAERMFSQSAKRLQPDGRLIVVANRHLPYLPKLKQHFRQVRQSGQNAKFIVYTCTLPRGSKEKHSS